MPSDPPEPLVLPSSAGAASTGNALAPSQTVVAPGEAAAVRRVYRLPAVTLRSGYVLGAVSLFVLALEVLKAGAGGVESFLTTFSVDGAANLMGFGWLGAYLVASGSPVAITSVTLFTEGVISDIEAFAMLNGARFGASFIVLLVGFLYYVYYFNKQRSATGIFIGVVALLTTFTMYAPVVPLGALTLHEGWFDSLQLSAPGAVSGFLESVYGPLVDAADERLHQPVMFVLGIGLLVASFALFDRALPNLGSASGGRMERIRDRLHHPLAMFLLGLVITALTLSVAVSLTLLIPLAHKGYVRREEIIPYVMGANISTWLDTMVAGLLLDSPRAFTIVFTQMALATTVSLFILLIAYGPYSSVVIAAARRITRSRWEFALFLSAIFLVPLALFFA